ncbi:conjugal transfer protein [Enterococcus faecium]|uniref:Conjugal transfer protein n=1 Tax=Enterococcus faecium TaxID=1352 RepID=A0A242AZZ9_ENTFC|nr:conjugal transfer protein [Enterococcus faecium]OTN86633.1 hypothetical protein A5810_003031 [Enterococcus faecium]
MKKSQLRRKEKTEKIPKQKTIHSKKIIKWVWLALLFLCFSGGFAFFQSMKASMRVSMVKEEIHHLQQREASNQAELVFTPEIESFMNRFVALFMNTLEDYEHEQARQEMLLKEFYAQDWSQEIDSPSGVRKLTAASLIGLKKVENVPTASYKVSYEIHSVDEKDKKEATTTVTQVLNIPFKTSNKGCRVVAYPYFTAIPENTEKQTMLTYDESLYETADPTISHAVESFVKDFLEKYAKNSAKDMAYMMKEPEGLNQTSTVDQVEMKVLTYKDKERPIIVKAMVTFRDGGTSLLQREQMTLVITKRADQYYVEKLTHNWLDTKEENK